MTDTTEDYAELLRLQPYLWAAGAYCFATAFVVALGAYWGRLPGHDLNQIVPFLCHLMLSGAAIAFFAWSRLSDSSIGRSATLRVGNLLLLFGLGVVGVVLAIQAAFQLTLENSPALLLIIPGVAPFLPFLPTFYRKRRDYPSADVLEEPPRLPISDTLRVYADFIIRLTLFAVALLAVIELAPLWFAVLKKVLWASVRYSAMDIGRAALLGAIPSRRAAFMVLGFFLLLVFSGVFSLFERVFRKEASLSEAQRELVESRLRSLWDYANAPGQARLSIGVILVAMVPLVLTLGLGFALLLNAETISQWLARPSDFVAGQGWHFFVRNDRAAMLLPFFCSLAFAWSAYQLCIDAWPRALQGAMVYRLQRGGGFQLDKVYALRRALSRDVLRNGAREFDPREFLLARHRRASHRLYFASLVLLLVSAMFVWRTVSSYVLVTDTGFTSVSFFTGQKNFHRYSDVARVNLECSPPQKNASPTISYDVGFEDGQTAELLLYDGLPSSVDDIVRIDRRLRSARTRFVLFVDAKLRVQGVRACVRRLASEYGHADGFAHIMHVD